MNENSWLYFFSANAQVFASLIAILGVFLVFVLQWIQSSIEWSRSDLVHLCRPIFNTPLETLVLDKQLALAEEYVRKHFDNGGKDDTFNDIQGVITVIRNQRVRRKVITKEFKVVLLFNLIILGASLLLLPWQGLVSKQFCVALTALLITLFASICSLIQTGLFINKSLGRESSKIAG